MSTVFEAAKTPFTDPSTDWAEENGPWEALVNSRTQDHIDGALKTLKPREERIIRLKFGLSGDRHAMNYKEIARIEKISSSSIQQIAAFALRKLRRYFRSNKLAEFFQG